MLELLAAAMTRDVLTAELCWLKSFFVFGIKGLIDFLRCGLAARALAAGYIWPMDGSTGTQIGVTIRQTVYSTEINDVRQCD